MTVSIPFLNCDGLIKFALVLRMSVTVCIFSLQRVKD
jgi:hypothetical protein